MIVIDSNVLFSAMIRNSVTRKLILEYDGKFLLPEFVFEEMEKHKHEIQRKSGLKIEEFDLVKSKEILLKFLSISVGHINGR